LQYVVVALSALFVIVAVSTHLQLWLAIDWAALTWLQEILPRSVDLPFSMLSLLGSAEVTSLILLALVIVAPPRQRIWLFVAFAALTLVEIIGKSFISQPIPPRELVRSVHIYSLFSGKIKTAYAFPSGHAARTMFILVSVLAMVVASHKLSTRIKFLLFALAGTSAAVMLVSRVYLVEHWLSDVIGGALLGCAFASLALARQS
jgi:membrane-associated phospholipid phosphatase